MKKTILTLIAVVVIASLMVACLAGCNNDNDAIELKDLDTKAVSSDTNVTATAEQLSTIKVGLITLHGEVSTYDKNFIDAFNNVVAKLGIPAANVIIKSNVDETEACYKTAKDMVAQGCNYIFADSFGHETYMIQAAKEFPNVQFCHATGTKAITENLPNYHNAFASIYEGRYLAGVAAGLKLKEMGYEGKAPKVGYVGAWPYAEVISGYTSWFLGVRSIIKDATMEVKYTNSWYDETKEKESAEALIASGCVLISQHADSYGAPSACEAKNVPNVSYNGSTEASCPKTFIVSSKINWEPYFEYSIKSTAAGKAFATDWCGTIATGSVQLTEYGATATAAGTAEYVAAEQAKIQAGTLKVFDTKNFTVDGKTLTEYGADVIDVGDYKPDTNAIVNGVFLESVGRSAPYFNIIIDGITIK
jgi:basic membrane protein A